MEFVNKGLKMNFERNSSEFKANELSGNQPLLANEFLCFHSCFTLLISLQGHGVISTLLISVQGHGVISTLLISA